MKQRHFQNPQRIAPMLDGRSTADLPVQKTHGWLGHMTTEQQDRWRRATSIAYGRRPFFVYRQFDADGRLLYVGCTSNPDQRARSHRISTPWRVQIAETTHEMHPTRWVAEAHEAHAIATEAPLYNVVHSIDREAAQERLRKLAELEQQRAAS